METTHSGVGIASFVVGVITLVLMFTLFAIAGYMQAVSQGGIDETSAEAIMLGLAIIGGLFLCLVSLGLGIGGLFQKERKKIFAVLGVVFSSVTILITVLLMVIGSTG